MRSLTNTVGNLIKEDEARVTFNKHGKYKKHKENIVWKYEGNISLRRYIRAHGIKMRVIETGSLCGAVSEIY